LSADSSRPGEPQSGHGVSPWCAKKGQGMRLVACGTRHAAGAITKIARATRRRLPAAEVGRSGGGRPIEREFFTAGEPQSGHGVSPWCAKKGHAACGWCHHEDRASDAKEGGDRNEEGGRGDGNAAIHHCRLPLADCHLPTASCRPPTPPKAAAPVIGLVPSCLGETIQRALTKAPKAQRVGAFGSWALEAGRFLDSPQSGRMPLLRLREAPLPFRCLPSWGSALPGPTPATPAPRHPGTPTPRHSNTPPPRHHSTPTPLRELRDLRVKPAARNETPTPDKGPAKRQDAASTSGPASLPSPAEPGLGAPGPNSRNSRNPGTPALQHSNTPPPRHHSTPTPLRELRDLRVKPAARNETPTPDKGPAKRQDAASTSEPGPASLSPPAEPGLGAPPACPEGATHTSPGWQPRETGRPHRARSEGTPHRIDHSLGWEVGHKEARKGAKPGNAKRLPPADCFLPTANSAEGGGAGDWLGAFVPWRDNTEGSHNGTQGIGSFALPGFPTKRQDAASTPGPASLPPPAEPGLGAPGPNSRNPGTPTPRHSSTPTPLHPGTTAPQHLFASFVTSG
jgi:hypothetical protein